MAEKFLGRELDWWKTLLSFLQLIVVSIGLALFNFFLAWHDKRQSDNAQMVLLQTQLADEAPEKYHAGLQGLLLQGESGLDVVMHYISTNQDSCVSWQKAHSIVSSLGVKGIQSAETVQFLLTSWSCHPHALGRDAEFLHVLQEPDSHDGRNPCLLLASTALRTLSLFQEAALLASLDVACPEQGQNSLRDKLGAEFTTRVHTLNSGFVLIFFNPFSDFPSSESFTADSGSLTQMSEAMGRRFSNQDGGLDVLWEQLRKQSLVERITFGRFVLKAQIDAVIPTTASAAIKAGYAQKLKQRRKIMLGWINEGLKSNDRSERYVAVAALATFKWKGYVVSLRQVANHDSDPYIRQTAAVAADPFLGRPVQVNARAK